MKTNALSVILALLSLTFAILYVVERQRRQDAEERSAHSLGNAQSTPSLLTMPKPSHPPATELEKMGDDLEGRLEAAQPAAGRSATMFRANPIKGLERMMENPVMKEMVRTQQRGMIDLLYRDLVAQLALSEDEASHFIELLLDHQLAGMEQGAKMATASVAEREDLSESIKSAKDLAELDTLNASIAERAGKILSEEQMAVFLENQQQMQEMGLKMTVQMFGQENP